MKPIALLYSSMFFFESLEQKADVDAQKARDAVTQLKQDLNDLERKVGQAKLTLYATELQALHNDLDQLTDKRKGIDKTYEKTQDGRRGLLGQRQERMKARTTRNVGDLRTIEQNFIALDERLYKETGIVSERRMRARIEHETRALADSGAILTDANGNVIGVDQAKLRAAQGALEQNMRAGREVRSGNASGQTVAAAGAEGIIGGGMDKLGYQGKNVKNTIMIAKVLVGLMIFNYYRNNTSGLGEKLFRGAALYGLLSNNTLGGWDIFWKGGQNKVLNVDQFFGKGAAGELASYSPAMQKQHELLVKGRDKVEGLQRLFVPEKRDNLKQYLKFDGTTWMFDNDKFLTDYNLRAIGTASSPIIAATTDPATTKSLSDLNETGAGGVIASLIQADKYDKSAELNRQINAYLTAAGIKTVDDAVALPPVELDARLATALKDLKTRADLETNELAREMNIWLQKNYKGHVVVDGKAQEVKDIVAKGGAIPTIIAELQNKGLIREVAKGDALIVDDADTKVLVASLMALPDPFPESEANALIIAFNSLKAEFPAIGTAELKIVGGELYYQNNGRKVPLVGRSQATGLGFDFEKAGIKGASRNASTIGFRETLVFAEAITKIWTVAAGRIDKRTETTVSTTRTVESATTGGVDYNQSSKTAGPTVGMNEFPWDRSEGVAFGIGSGLDVKSQRGMFNMSDSIPYVNQMLSEALSRTDGKDIILHNFATLLNSMKMEDGKTSIWIEGQGKLPAGTLAVDSKGAVVEQGVKLNVKYDEITSLSELAKKMNDALVGGTKLIWGDVVNALTRVGGDLKEVLKAAIPATGEVISIAYDETTKGIITVYEDLAGEYEKNPDGSRKLGPDGQPILRKAGAMQTVYADGRHAVTVIGPDLKKCMSWVVQETGSLTREAIDQIVWVMDNLMKPENMEKFKGYIDNIGSLVGKTVEEAGEIIKNGVIGIIGGTNDIIWNWETAKLILTYLGYEFVQGIVS